MEPVRSFIAIELPDELKSRLAELQTQLKTGKHYSVKWVNPYSIHLTLKFLGSISIDSTREITNAMEDAIQGISPFHLEAKRLGVFPNLKRVQVIWVGISGETDKLDQLHKQLESRLARLDFSPESRPFTPHLTLARLRNQASPDERQQLGQAIASTKFKTACAINVDAINLMKSQLTREGAIYNKISSVRLKKPLPTATA
jgi:2'-5' RNA ligase